jgi:hypothetical protein
MFEIQYQLRFIILILDKIEIFDGMIYNKLIYYNSCLIRILDFLLD